MICVYILVLHALHTHGTAALSHRVQIHIVSVFGINFSTFASLVAAAGEKVTKK